MVENQTPWQQALIVLNLSLNSFASSTCWWWVWSSSGRVGCSSYNHYRKHLPAGSSWYGRCRKCTNLNKTHLYSAIILQSSHNPLWVTLRSRASQGELAAGLFYDTHLYDLIRPTPVITKKHFDFVSSKIFNNQRLMMTKIGILMQSNLSSLSWAMQLPRDIAFLDYSLNNVKNDAVHLACIQ